MIKPSGVVQGLNNNLGMVAAQQPSRLGLDKRLTHFCDRDGAWPLI
jgi:hypothetical protein